MIAEDDAKNSFLASNVGMFSSKRNGSSELENVGPSALELLQVIQMPGSVPHETRSVVLDVVDAWNRVQESVSDREEDDDHSLCDVESVEKRTKLF